MKVKDLVRAMEEIAPTRDAAPWDNVGLMVGDEEGPISRVLLAVDCTREVVEEARRERCDAIVSYHPPIFDPLKRLVAKTAVFEAARHGVAVYTPHTALDVAEGGTNDVLADALALAARAPLRPLQSSDANANANANLKLVTFVPAEHVEVVSRAVFSAGAGRIGKYSCCSFRAPGTGSFFGEEGANPAVGAAGRLEEVAEVRLETVVPASCVDSVVRALRASHPYEEPAFDLVRLADPPDPRGFGRVGTLEATPVRRLIARAKHALGLGHVLVAGPMERAVSRAAVCAGSGGEFVADAIAAGAQLLLTGELRHHDALRSVAAGLTVVCTLHSASERAALGKLEARLVERLPGVPIACSREDREPFEFG